MKIVSSAIPAQAQTQALSPTAAFAPAPLEAMQDLRRELEQLKQEVAALRAKDSLNHVEKTFEITPEVVPTVNIVAPLLPEKVVAPPVARPQQDPLFAQLWAYVNNAK